MVSWKITRPFGRMPGLTVLILTGILLICEIILRLEPVQLILPTPTLSRTQMYPELDIKWMLFEQYANKQKVNCFILGSSMAESNMDPDFFSAALSKSSGREISCFNFGLTGFKVENSADLAGLIDQQFHPEFILIGISAIDFDINSSETRDVTKIPWFRIMRGEFNLEGWLTENSMIYRYLSVLPKLRSQDYRNELKKSEKAIQPNGFRKNQGNFGITGDPEDIRLKDYSINPYDLGALIEILTLERKGTEVFVIEMPVMSTYLPIYLEGGEEGYRQKFLDPISENLQSEGSSLIKTQNKTSDLIPVSFWYNGNHLNTNGAEIFSAWLVDVITGQKTGTE